MHDVLSIPTIRPCHVQYPPDITDGARALGESLTTVLKRALVRQPDLQILLLGFYDLTKEPPLGSKFDRVHIEQVDNWSAGYFILNGNLETGGWYVGFDEAGGDRMAEIVECIEMTGLTLATTYQRIDTDCWEFSFNTQRSKTVVAANDA